MYKSGSVVSIHSGLRSVSFLYLTNEVKGSIFLTSRNRSVVLLVNGKVGNFEVLGGRRPVGGHRRLSDEESLTFAALDAMGRKDGDELRHGRAGAQHALLVAVAIPAPLWIKAFYELNESRFWVGRCQALNSVPARGFL